MGVLFGHRPPVDTRVLVLLRVDSLRLAAALPPGLAPRACRGTGLLVVDFACRRGWGAGWQALLAKDEAPVSQLAWRVPVLREIEGRAWPELWVAKRVASPGLGADWPRRLVGLHRDRVSFQVTETGTQLEIAAHLGEGTPFQLCAESRPGLAGSVFGGVREASEEFARFGPLSGASPIFSPAERARLVPVGLTLEPLLVHSLEVETLRADGGVLDFEVDSAFRLVDRTRRPARARLAEFARLAGGGAAPGVSPALCERS